MAKKKSAKTTLVPLLPITLNRDQWQAIYLALHHVTDPRASVYRLGLQGSLQQRSSQKLTLKKPYDTWVTLNNWLFDLPAEKLAFQSSQQIIAQLGHVAASYL